MLKFLLYQISLLISIWSRKSTLAYLGGIQYYSVSLNNLSAAGCKECFAIGYNSDYSITEKLSECTGPYLFVGAIADGTNVFKLGAYDKASIILQTTPRDGTQLSNDVHWYFTPGYSFGFLDSPDLIQNPVDRGVSHSDSRLSWSLSQDQEGFRAGSLTFETDQSVLEHYKKSVFNCPDESQSMRSESYAVSNLAIIFQTPSASPSSRGSLSNTNTPSSKPQGGLEP